MAELTLHTHIAPRGPAGALLLTDAQVAELAAGKRAPVLVTIGGASARLRLAVMGGENMIGLSKANRALLGVEIGDEVTAVVTVDDAPREVELPVELAEALAGDEVARAAYEKLAFTHRKEYAAWVASAVREATRVSRVAKALEMLRAGQTVS
jgi:predicted metal-dependent HD superfamily phosphohydrolase